MFTGPICSIFWRSVAAGLFFGGQFFAGDPAQSLHRRAELAASAFTSVRQLAFQVLQVGLQLCGLAGSAARDLRATGPAPRARS